MNRIAIWGCGGHTKEILKHDLIDWEEVVIFCDSNIEMQGKYYCGRIIESPRAIGNNNIEIIVIGTELFFESARDEALKLYPNHMVLSIDEYEKRYGIIKKNSAIHWDAKNLHSQLEVGGAISQTQIEGAMLLADRIEAIKRLPKGGVIGEVGVAYGDFSKKLLEIMEPSKFYAIDFFNKDNPYISFWGRTDFEDSGLTHEEWYRKKFEKEIKVGQMEVISGFSWDCLSIQKDNTYDFLYIDACHDYESVKKDISIAYDKVKNGGIIQFNDYTLWDMFGQSYYGVVPAVNEFINRTNSKVLFYCLNINGFSDLVVKVNK